MFDFSEFKVLIYTENQDMILNLKLDYLPKYSLIICTNKESLNNLNMSLYDILVLDSLDKSIYDFVMYKNSNINVVTINNCHGNFKHNLNFDVNKIDEFKKNLDELVIKIFSKNKIIVNFIVKKIKKIKGYEMLVYLNFKYKNVTLDIFCENSLNNILFKVFENFAKFNRSNISLYEVEEYLKKDMNDVQKKDYFRKTIFNNLNKIFDINFKEKLNVFKYNNGRIFLDESKVFLDNSYVMKNMKNKMKLLLNNNE